MSRRTTTVELEEEQLQELERLAAKGSASVQDLVRQAVGQFLQTNDDGWSSRFDALAARVRARIPSDVTPDQIESDISEAAIEARAERARR